MNLYLDIETIPSQDPAVHAQIAESITPPGNISKPETIAAWGAEKKPALVKDAIAKTALDGSLGHICCIGWAWEDGQSVSQWIESVHDEAESFRAVLSSWEVRMGGRPYEPVTIVGHNVVNFDIRFIWQRAIILGVKMPHWFPRDPKPWGNDVFDTMTAFAGQRNTISLDRLSKALGYPGKEEIDGSMVGKLWSEGRHEEIASYCRSDVERTREIHRRMMVAYGEAA